MRAWMLGGGTIFLVGTFLGALSGFGHDLKHDIDMGQAREAAGRVDCGLPKGITIKNSGVNLSNLSSEVCNALDDIVDVWDDNNAPDPVITSGNDSKHRGSNAPGTDCGTVENCRNTSDSRHYDDRAIDLRGNNVSDDTLRGMAEDLKNALGEDYDVEAEIFPGNPSNDHIHMEYNPPPGAGI
jgi:hypothetical protein